MQRAQLVRLGFGIVSLSLFIASPARALQSAPRYTAAVFAPPAPHVFATPLDMNAAGIVSLYAADAERSPLAQPFLLDPERGFRPFPGPDSYYIFLLGFEETELFVGRSNQQASTWRDGVPALLVPPAGFFSGTANDVNGAGRVVGSAGDSDFIGPHPCTWSSPTAPGELLPPLFPEAPSGSANAINAGGQIAGTSGAQVGAFHAVRWDDPALPPFQIGPLPGAINGQALDLNVHGDVVGICAFPDNSVQAFLYVDGPARLIPLGFFLPGTYSEARSVNTALQVVGTARVSPGVAHAFLWQNGVLHDLNDLLVLEPYELAYLSSANVVNDAGTIAAEAVLRDGRTGIAMLRPIP